MKLKNVLLTGLSFVLVASVAVGGTLAYLTSTDDDVNVMTLGNVSIVQDEYQRVTNADGTFSAELEAFKQGKLLMPYVNRDNTPDTVTIGDFTAIFNDQYTNYIDKIVAVTNNGKSDAYVRTLIALPSGGWEEQESASDNWLHWNTWGKNPETGKYDMDATWDSCYDNDDLVAPTVIEINGMEYQVYEFVHTAKLAPGATACPTLTGLYMDCRVNNDDTGYYMDLNNNNKFDKDTEKRIDIPVGEPLNVYVLSQAVQTEGFADAFTALDTGFGDVTKDTAAEWFGGMSNVQFVEADEEKAQIEGNPEDLENGTDLIVDEKIDILMFDTNSVDAKGATVTLNGVGPEAYGYLAFLPDAGEDVTVSNLNVTGSGFVEIGHYGQGGGDYTVNNLVIENLASTLANGNKGFTLGCAFMAFGDTTLNNCVMTGTTAVQDGVMAVDLGCGQAWSGYTDGNDNKISTTINGGEYGTVYCWSHAIVTVNGAKIDTMYAAPINGTVTINSGTHIGTLNVDYGTSTANATRLAKLVIEDGATVDAIEYNENSYTVAEWNAYVDSL